MSFRKVLKLCKQTGKDPSKQRLSEVTKAPLNSPQSSLTTNLKMKEGEKDFHF